MTDEESRALPIAGINSASDGPSTPLELGPVVSSAHLAAGQSPGLSELEYGLMIASSAFNRWMVRCMAAAGLPGLSSTEVVILHSVAHRGREKRMADIALVLDIEDTHVVTYAVKKLEAAGLIVTRRVAKEKIVAISDKGYEACQRYGKLREKLLLDSTRQSRPEDSDLSETAALLRFFSGAYNQAARAAATY